MRLGRGYHRLWTAAAISSLGDGILVTALPLGTAILAVVVVLAVFAVNNQTIHAARAAAETASPINGA